MDVMKSVPFEDALTLTGFGIYNLKMLVLAGSIVIAMAVEFSSVGFLVPASACELLTTSEQQGMMAAVPLFGILIASNIWGYLADTKGRQKMILLALALGFIASFLSSLSPNWIVFCVLKFLSACAMAGSFGLATTYLGESTPESKRSLFICSFTAIYAIVIGVMAVIAIPILPLKFSFYIPVLGIYFNSWRLLSIFYSLPCLFGSLGFIWAPESPKFLMSIGKEDEALQILKAMYAANTGKHPDMFKVTSLVLNEDTGAERVYTSTWRSIVMQVVPLLKPPLLKNTLLMGVIFISVYSCVNSFTIWMPYLVDGVMRSLEKGETGLTVCDMLRSSQNDTMIQSKTPNLPNDCSLDKSAMIILLAVYLILALFNILMSMLLPWYGRKNMLITILLVTGLAALLVSFSTVFIVSCALIMTFVLNMLNFGLLNTFSVDMFPTYVKAMGVCLVLMVGRGSAVFGINFVKTLLTYNCEATWYYFAGMSLFGAIFGLLLPTDKKIKTSQKQQTERSKISG